MIGLRTVALCAVGAGAAGSIVAMMRVGRNAPIFLLVLFAGWILVPFAALVLAANKGKQWPELTRVTLYVVMLVVSIGSFALYADVALRPPASTPAARFLLVPLASLLLMAIVIPVAGLIARR